MSRRYTFKVLNWSTCTGKGVFGRMEDVPERSEIGEEYKWDLDSVYADREEWEQAYDAVYQYIDRLEGYEGRLLDSPQQLHEALLLNDQISRRVGTLNFYAEARKREDLRVDQYQEMSTLADALSSDANRAASFIKPEIQEADRDQIAEMVEAYGPLQVYDQYLEDIMDYQEYTLVKEQEELISELGPVLGNEQDIHNQLMNADLLFPTVETPDGDEVTVTHSNRASLLRHPDRAFRKEVYDAFTEAWSQYDNTLASNYANKVRHGVTFADIRGFDSVRSRKLDANNIPEDVYDSLIEAVKDSADSVHRQRELLQDVLNVDEIRPWDGYMPLATAAEPDIPYETAVQHVIDSLEPLGADYRDVAREGLLSEGWVDVYENQGKRSGAFSWGTYDTKPFIFLNHEDDIDSMYTLAHELGHAMHSHLANQEQPYQHASYPIFSAEVASNVNEALLTDHLLDTVEDTAFREHVMAHQANNIKGSLFTQTMFADFEHQVHRTVEEGDPLTVETLDGIYGTLRDEYFGADSSDRSKKGWMRIPHFYRPFYVYQYATGISAALSLSQQILDRDDPEAAERYTDFLKAGGSDDPIPLLQDAGVDLTGPDPVEDAITTYDETLDQLEHVLAGEHAG